MNIVARVRGWSWATTWAWLITLACSTLALAHDSAAPHGHGAGGAAESASRATYYDYWTILQLGGLGALVVGVAVILSVIVVRSGKQQR